MFSDPARWVGAAAVSPLADPSALRPHHEWPGPALPAPRGPLSEALFERLTGGERPLADARRPHDPLGGDDFHLALYCAYELHYRGFAGVDPAWEWAPELLSWRAALERSFEGALRDEVGRVDGADPVGELHRIINEPGPSLSGFMEQQGTAEQMREFVVHRSPYQLKEADPHTWAIPRLDGRAKAAMVQLQADEYGGGVQAEMHATLFADTMAELGLDATYGGYLDVVPGFTLATTNIITLFGLHRRLRGALVGHLALFEMTSVGPMGRYSAALGRLGWGERARRFYDVHVVADELHQVVAAEELVRPLVENDRTLGNDVVFGARAATVVEARFAGSLLAAWDQGQTSLRRPLSVG